MDGLILDSPFHSFKKAFLQITPTFLLPYVDIEAFMAEIDMAFDNVKVNKILKWWHHLFSFDILHNVG